MSPMKEVNDTIYKIIGACMEVHRSVGPGFPVDLYKKALEIEMKGKGKELEFATDKSVDVTFKETVIGSLSVDFIINENVVFIVRSQVELNDTEIQQTLRLMKLVGAPIGLLMNFGGIKIQYKRVLPGRQSRDIKSDGYQPMGYRSTGRTRAGNPIN